ncbi:MAG TPA: methylated-DNA--[protein]-cysteine S-methyltransferase [Mariprofundaceae bacterium]|nr:methylated-DNA--[protein]-cysteine S-methyltransferase [Mariprofundaceae bacterium]
MIVNYKSPLGTLAYEWDGQYCTRLWLGKQVGTLSNGTDPVAKWLEAYFNGRILSLPLLAKARTAFQANLRQSLLAIPFGETRTYGELARQLHTAPRALGQALGANPLPLLVPCHRVVAAGSIGGFSCGVEWKRALLEFERGG